MRRHHNNTGEHQVRTGQTRHQIAAIAKSVGVACPHQSKGEVELAFQLRAARLPPGEPQHQFYAEGGRRWAFDFVWVDRRLAVEVDGSVHRIKGRFRDDLERSRVAAALGWTVLRFSPQEIHGGRPLRALELVLGPEAVPLDDPRVLRWLQAKDPKPQRQKRST